MFQTVLRLQWIKSTKIVSILLSISPLLDYKIKLEQNTKSEQENSRCEHFYNLPCLNKNIICFIIYKTTIYSENPKIKLSITWPDHRGSKEIFFLLLHKSVVIISIFLVIICQIVRTVMKSALYMRLHRHGKFKMSFKWQVIGRKELVWHALVWFYSFPVYRL